MNTRIPADELGQAHHQFGVRYSRSEDELPEPPDNFDVWNSFPEEHREKVANQFARGIDREHDLMRVRVAEEYAAARRRQDARTGRARNGGRR